MSTVRPGVMQILLQDNTRKGQIVKLDVEISQADLMVKLIESLKSNKKVVNLEEAEIIVSGGRGLGSKENFNNIETLIPTSKTKYKFESITGPIDHKIYMNTIEIRHLVAIRDTLLPNLMSGEIRIKPN